MNRINPTNGRLLLALLALTPSVVCGQSTPPPFTMVSSASFLPGVLAPNSIVTGFGAGLATETLSAPPGGLPTELGGISINIVPNGPGAASARLYSVSPTQVNFLIPPDLPAGPATILVQRGRTVLASGTAEIAPVSPGLFSAGQTGSGLIAGRAAISAGNAGATSQLIANCTSSGVCMPVPIVGAPGSTVVLELYGTGIRGRTSLAAVSATAVNASTVNAPAVNATTQGTPLEVLYAGAQSEFPGLDQVNVRVPASLLNSGLAQVVLTVDGKYANVLSVQFGGVSPGPASVQFNPAVPQVGPFPTDALTVADARQRTGLRVSLPLPDCAVQATTCQTYQQLNELDGFSSQPTIAVRFSSAVDPTSVTRGVRIVWLNRVGAQGRGLQDAGHQTGIERVILDPVTNTAYGRPNEPMDQNRRYALVVTDAVRDAFGNPIVADAGFQSCVASPATDYCRQLAQVQSALGPLPGRVVGASLFTTMSATSWLERAREVVENTPVNFRRAADVNLVGLTRATLRLQRGSNPVSFEEVALPVPLLIGSGLNRLVFGSFTSPNFLDDRQSIPPMPTNDRLTPRATPELPFHAYLPGSKPAAGYPVVIFGHGLTDTRFGGPSIVAGSFVKAGFAVLAINAVGHGSGPQSELVVSGLTGSRTIPAPGRGIDQNNDGTIGLLEGCLAAAPGILVRDCLRQTAVDLMQLVHAMKSGMDLDGDGTADVDRTRVYYTGQSLGTLYGAMVSAVVPEIRAVALNVSGGPVIDFAPISVVLKPLAAQVLAVHMPPLLNQGTTFNSNPMFRDQPARVNTVPGAMEIQNYFGLLGWLHAVGDPISFAPYLRRAPLPGVGEKRLLMQIARGDHVIPNPANSNMVRQAGGENGVVLYRHDIARQNTEGLTEDPHAFLFDVSSVASTAVALAAQGQIAGFFGSDGMTIPEANNAALTLLFRGNRVFERPATLPEDLGFQF